SVRRDGDDRALLRLGQPGKGVGDQRVLHEGARELSVLRVEQDRESPAIEAFGGLLRAHSQRKECRNEPAADYGSPPSSTVFNASMQRFPHGLNLFAA